MKTVSYNDGRRPIDPSSPGYVPRREVLALVEGLKERGSGLHFFIASRKSGKTSALRTIGHELSERRSVTVDLRLALDDADKSRPAIDGIRKILNFIGSELRVQTGIGVSSQEFSASRPAVLVRDFFFAVEKAFPRWQLLLFLDEIESLGKNPSVAQEFLEGLRAVFQSPEPPSFAAVATSLMHPSLIAEGLNRGDLMVGRTIRLLDFGDEPDTVDRWATGLDLPGARQLAQTILDYSGGQPSITNALLHSLEKSDVTDPGQLPGFFQDELERVSRQEGLFDYFSTSEDVIMGMGDDRATVVGRVGELMSRDLIANSLRPRERSFLEMSGLVREKGGYYQLRAPVIRELLEHGWIGRLEDQLARQTSRRARAGRKSIYVSTPRLLLINCGGTIGMERAADDTMQPPRDTARFLDKFASVREITEFAEISQIVCKDGINIGPQDWIKIANVISANRGTIDGVVVLHGTDTMAYTASAVAYQLGTQLDIPVVFTGSQLPHDVDHSDAEDNFRRACVVASYNLRSEVEQAKAQPLQEVVIVYLDEVYRAVRAEKRDDFQLRGFHCPTGEVLAEMTEPLVFKERLLRRPPSEPNTASARTSEFSSKIFKIAFHPGLNPDLLKGMLDNPEIEAFILQTPGVGNVPNEGDASLVDFIREARRRDKPVVITHQIPISLSFSSDYKPATAAYEAGAVRSGNMAEPAAITKVMWQLPMIREQLDHQKKSGGMETCVGLLERAMATDYVLELAKNDDERTRLNQAQRRQRNAG